MKNKGMLKRTVAFFVLSMSIIFLFLGVLAQATEAEASEVRYELTFTPGKGLPEELDKGNTDYAYRDFKFRTNSEERRALYDSMYEICNAFWGSSHTFEGEGKCAVIAKVDVRGLTSDEITETYCMFMNDNPVFYFLSQTIGISETDTGYELCIYTEFLGQRQRLLIETTLPNYIVRYESTIDPTSIYNTVFAMNDALIRSMVYFYEDDGVTPKKDFWAHSIAGALRYGGGTCEAFARTLQVLLNYYGYDNVIVTGTASGKSHVWNLVKMDDGEYYYVDATWNAVTFSGYYIACGEEVFADTHECNDSTRRGVDFLYDIPDVSKFNYLKNVSVYKDNLLVGSAGSIRGAFWHCTDNNGKYRLMLEDSTFFYLPEGEWPEVEEIAFDHKLVESGEYYYPMVLGLTGDSYINSNLIFNNINLCGYNLYEPEVIPTLHVRDYTLVLEGKGNSVGHYDPTFRCGLDGPKATIITNAEDRFELWNVEFNIGSVYLNDDWLLFRSGEITFGDLYVTKEETRIDFSRYCDSSMNVTIGTLHLDYSCSVRVDLSNGENSLHIGEIVQENKMGEETCVIDFYCATNSRRILPFFEIGNSEVEIEYVIWYVELGGYTREIIEEKMEQCEDSRLLSYYYSIYGQFGYEAFEASSDVQNIFEYDDPWLNIGTTDPELLEFTCRVAGLENTCTAFDNDFIEIDGQGNVRRVRDEVIEVVDGVLTKAKMFTLENVTLVIPENATSIAQFTFDTNCISKIVVPAGVQYIEEYALTENDASEFVVDENNPYFTAIDGVLYTKSVDKIVAFPSAKRGTFTLPDTVTEIAEGVFGSWKYKLKKITIPSSVDNISRYQFGENESEEIEVNCCNIDDKAFFANGCRIITFGSEVKNIGSEVFEWADFIESVYIFNPEVKLADAAFASMDAESVIIYGYEGSTAEEYVRTYGEEYDLIFCALSDSEDPVGAFVDRIYTTMLERDPDANRQDWIDKLTSGTYTGAQIIDEFFGSQEFMAKNAAMSDEEFVTIMYRTMFDRDPDAGGLADWTGKLSEGYVRRFVMAGVVNSDEFKSLCNRFCISAGEMSLTMAECTPGLSEQEFAVWQFVERLYVEVLGRTPDPTGMADWSDKLFDGGWTGTQVAVDGFLVSAEFMAKAEDMTNEAFVQTMYRVFFDRDGDAIGMTTWQEKLAEGYSRRYIYGGFTNSGEFQNVCDKYGITRGELALSMADNTPNLTAQEINIWNFVERLYMEVLGRPADRAGMADWSGKLLNGTMTGAQAAEGVIMSQEFLGRSENLTNEEYVLIMYKAFFNRIPGAQESINWVNALNNNLETRRGVFASFANAQEFANLCASYGITQGSVAE